MNSIEERLRAAANAAGETVAPDSTPPLRLPGSPGWRLRGPGRRARAAWPRTLVPLAAAAAVTAVVAAVVATSLAVTDGAHGRQPGSASAVQGSRPGSHAGPVIQNAASQAALASVPPFYVALAPGGMSQNNHAVVRATATGALLATVAPPRPYGAFDWVTAASDDRTFVLAAQPWVNTGGGIDDKNEPTKFFLLRLSASGRMTGLTALPIPQEPASAWIDGIALSPDGSELAVADDRAFADDEPAIQVFSLATGAGRKWVWPGTGVIGNDKPLGSPLSWTADGRTLAFQLDPQNGTLEVRLLDTAAPGSSLRSSRLAVEWVHGGVTGASGVVIAGPNQAPSNSLRSYNTLITPDGTKIVCVTSNPQLGGGGVTEFLASTAQVAGVAYPQASDVLWASTTGSTLIVANSTAAGVLTRGQFTPIPGTSQASLFIAW